MRTDVPTPHPLTILVADDDADTANSFAELLSIHGHRVHAACNGREALRLAESAEPDVVLLDILMPGLDGCEVARLIRERCESGAKRPLLVAVTGCSNLDTRLPASLGVVDIYFLKPLDPAVLVGVLERVRRLLAPPTPAAELKRPSEELPEEEPNSPGARAERAFARRFAFAGS